jgi:hypothetical protein
MSAAAVAIAGTELTPPDTFHFSPLTRSTRSTLAQGRPFTGRHSALKAEFKLGFSFGIRFVESHSEAEEPDIQGFTTKPLAQESLEILDR